MKKETFTEKLIKRTYGISDPLDEYKRREADRIGNQVFIFLFYLMIFGNLIPLVLAYKYPQEVALDGRISVITFHSLEDRLTKQLFKEASTVEVPKGLPFIPDDLKPKMELVSRKPILPSAEELEANNRSHSAKLRVARKIHK